MIEGASFHLANTTFFVHVIFVFLVLPSLFLALTGYYTTHRRLAVVHNASVAVMIVGGLLFGRCPLVELEEGLREAAGDEMWYDGSFTRFVVAMITGIDLPAPVVSFTPLLIGALTLASVVLSRIRWSRPVTSSQTA